MTIKKKDFSVQNLLDNYDVKQMLSTNPQQTLSLYRHSMIVFLPGVLVIWKSKRINSKSRSLGLIAQGRTTTLETLSESEVNAKYEVDVIEAEGTHKVL